VVDCKREVLQIDCENFNPYANKTQVPDGNHAPDQRELVVDFFRIIGRAPGGEETITSKPKQATFLF
jgi:hypothetical protein